MNSGRSGVSADGKSWRIASAMMGMRLIFLPPSSKEMSKRNQSMPWSGSASMAGKNSLASWAVRPDLGSISMVHPALRSFCISGLSNRFSQASCGVGSGTAGTQE